MGSCLGFRELENADAPPVMIHRHWGTALARRPRFQSWCRRRVAAHAAVCRRCAAVTVDDEADEPDGTVTATVAAGFGWRVAEGGASAAVTVLDNDAAPAREAEGATIWLADMQVVDYENGTIGAANASLFSNVRGELDLDPKWLWYYAPGRTLRLAFATGVANVEGVTLQAGDVALAFPQGSAGSSGFTWTDVDAPGWSDGETVTAQLVKRSQSAVSNDATLGALSV